MALSADELLEHRKKEHPMTFDYGSEPTEIICKVCGMKFETQANVISHLQEVHMNSLSAIIFPMTKSDTVEKKKQRKKARKKADY